MHAISNVNNRNEMAYIGEKPWHGLGQELQDGATIEQWQQAAGMDWKIQRAKVRYAIAHGSQPSDYAEWPEYNVLMRSDNKAPLGMVSDRFKVVQPHDVLEFFRDLVEVAGFKLSTAGTLYGGRKFWALADIKTEDRIVGNDLIRGKLLLATACDGSMRTIAKNVAERVVCANTLAIAMDERGAPQVTVSHRTNFDAKAVKAQLGVAVDSFHKFIHNAKELSLFPINNQRADAFLCNLLATEPLANTDKDSLIFNTVRETAAYKRILDLFQGQGKGASLPGVKGTAWGLVNAVTEYHDHHHGARTDSAKLNHAWFGAGDVIKQAAMQQAMVLVA